MNEEEHRQFIEDVQVKFGIPDATPEVGTPDYLKAIMRQFTTAGEGRSLLANCMTAHLIGHCRDVKNYEPLLELGDEMVALLQNKECDANVLVAANELRSAIFWGNLRHDQWDIKKIEAETRLLCALTGADYKKARITGAVLAHGELNYGPGWDRYTEAEKS